MEETLDLVDERFNEISSSFTFLLEDKILLHLNTEEEKNEVFDDLLHLAKLIPSLLVEQGRIKDAIELIQSEK